MHQPAITLLRSASVCHPTAVWILIHQYLICWDATFLDSILLGFGFLLIALQLQANNRVILQTKFCWPDCCERSWQLWCYHLGLGIEVNKRLSKRGFKLLERIWDPKKVRQMYFIKDNVWRYAVWWLGLILRLDG